MFSEKFNMVETLEESFKYFKMKFLSLTCNTVAVMIVFLFLIGAISGSAKEMLNTIKMSGTTSFESGYSAGMIFGSLLVIVPIFLLLMSFMLVYIKIIDDAYENRCVLYLDQVKFTFGKVGKVVLANAIIYLPALVVGFNLLKYINEISLEGFIVIGTAFNLISLFFVMVNYSLIIENVSAFGAIKRSLIIMRSNFMRFLVFLIGFGMIFRILVIVFSVLVGLSSSVGTIASFIVVIGGFFLIPMPAVFLTLLFKSITHRPYDSDEVIEHDDLHINNKKLYYDE